jgi:hypothetical protein
MRSRSLAVLHSTVLEVSILRTGHSEVLLCHMSTVRLDKVDSAYSIILDRVGQEESKLSTDV